MPANLQKWKRAVVHLEAQLGAARSRGTAILLEARGGHYLVTAAHVLADATGLAHKIFRVPQLGEASLPREFIMNPEPDSCVANGPDLLVLSLEWKQTTRAFALDLIASGCIPIQLSDLGDCPTEEGDEIFSVGYPDATAVLRENDLPAALANWASSKESLPVFSWGHVAQLRPDLADFLGDITVFPGNSGGPIVNVETGLLVGVVSQQFIAEGGQLLPFMQGLKCHPLVEMVEELERNWARSHPWLRR